MTFILQTGVGPTQRCRGARMGIRDGADFINPSVPVLQGSSGKKWALGGLSGVLRGRAPHGGLSSRRGA